MTPRFDLFAHEGVVLVDVDTDDERPFDGPWPVQVWFTAADFGDGRGWKRGLFERRGKVVRHHLHDVGAGDTTEAVLVEVPTAADFLALCAEQQFELADTEPAEL